jgi:hypothetical protein
MTSNTIIAYRLYNQQITHHRFSAPGEIVSWLGAMQAQDFAGGKWAIGLRLPGSKDPDIEKAIAARKIIRTWALRGILHFVSPEDVYWITKLIGPKLLTAFASRFRQLELDERILAKTNKLISKALEGGEHLTRNEIADILSKQKIKLHEFRLSHILLRAVIDQLICFGPRRNKEYTFVSLPEWVPEGKSIPRDESLAMLTRKYFESHGPAALPDFVWWSGLNLTDARKGIEMIKSGLEEFKVNDQKYWMMQNMPEIKAVADTVFLLPGFDEYMLGYKDRSLILDNHRIPHVYTNNGIFGNTIIIKGRVHGTWKRTIKNKSVIIEQSPFIDLSDKQLKSFNKASQNFAKFLGLEMSI